ncbi:MAG: ATP-binding cassette domain-containing protein [Gallintestinimicrobium sp.]
MKNCRPLSNQLSGGQRQRVCIGEALMTNPGLWWRMRRFLHWM